MSIAITAEESFYTVSEINQSIDIGVANLVVILTINSAAPTYGGQAFTEQENQTLTFHDPTGESAPYAVYTLVNPPTGSNTLLIEAAEPQKFVFFLGLSGVETSDPVEGTDFDTATSGDPSLAVTQSENRGSLFVAIGTVSTVLAGSNYISVTSPWDERIDAQGVEGNTNVGRWAGYAAFSGTGSLGTGGNITANYSTAIRQSCIGLLVNAHANRAQMLTQDP